MFGLSPVINIYFRTRHLFCLNFDPLKTIIMGNLGFQEILLIAVVVLVLFGGRKIPEFMRGLGKGIREFNDAKTNVKREIEDSANEVKNSPNTHN